MQAESNRPIYGLSLICLPIGSIMHTSYLSQSKQLIFKSTNVQLKHRIRSPEMPQRPDAHPQQSVPDAKSRHGKIFLRRTFMNFYRTLMR